jgi:acyl carrier protein
VRSEAAPFDQRFECFEMEFGISIPDDKAEKIGTVGDAIAYIEENAK